MKNSEFISLITEEVAELLLNGNTIIKSHYSEKRNNGYMLIRLNTPIKEQDGDREWHYYHFEVLYGHFYLASTHVKTNINTAIKWSSAKYYSK